jgi:hypothetical protein
MEFTIDFPIFPQKNSVPLYPQAWQLPPARRPRPTLLSAPIAAIPSGAKESSTMAEHSAATDAGLSMTFSPDPISVLLLSSARAATNGLHTWTMPRWSTTSGIFPMAQ